jgi:hypothetical protein
MFALIIIGEKGNLTEQVAKQRGAEVAAGINLMQPHEMAEFAIFGFDDDPREIWDIPETRDYFLAFAEALLENNVIQERILPQTWDTIKACHAVHAGKTVRTVGTVDDALREGIEQVMEHMRKHLHS